MNEELKIPVVIHMVHYDPLTWFSSNVQTIQFCWVIERPLSTVFSAMNEEISHQKHSQHS